MVDYPIHFSFEELEKQVVGCRLCPRLVAHRENVTAAAAFKDQPHWRRPVPGFGDPNAKLFILGLAPSPQGGNRTGRIFTGDQTGKFLFKALFEAGFANQPFSQSRDDGLKVHGCFLSASVKCVPPNHKPLPHEFANCSRYFINEMFLLKKVKCLLCLGSKAFDTYVRFLRQEAGIEGKFPKFAHGLRWQVEGWPTLFASYHPTPQNVNTGKLTAEMFSSLLHTIKQEIGSP